MQSGNVKRYNCYAKAYNKLYLKYELGGKKNNGIATRLSNLWKRIQELQIKIYDTKQ